LSLLPDGISLLTALTLCGISFFTSALTAAIGLGGGLALLSVLASLLPPLAVIPVHGLVQLGSNSGRVLIQRAHIGWAIVAPFAAGAALGALAGGQAVFALPPDVLKGVLGAFILVMLWGPKPKFDAGRAWVFALAGAVSSFITMFVGATGPFVASVLSPARMTRHQLVATHAACMTLQHGLKIAVFGLLGFAFGPWLALIAGMVAAGFAGTILGSRLLSRLPERGFRMAFNGVLSVLALNLIYRAVVG